MGEVTREELIALLLKVEGNRPDSLGICSQWYRNPEGPQAADTITALQAELAEARAEVERLREEMARRDANENRNCINWGPCSRHDKRMADLDEYGPGIGNEALAGKETP
jgi:hypothetical protein